MTRDFYMEPSDFDGEELTPEEDERLTFEKRQEEADQADRSELEEIYGDDYDEDEYE